MPLWPSDAQVQTFESNLDAAHASNENFECGNTSMGFARIEGSGKVGSYDGNRHLLKRCQHWPRLIFVDVD